MLGGAVAAWPLAARAQQGGGRPRVPRVGILSPYTASASSFQDDIKRGLMDLGHLEGRTVEFKSMFADGRTDQLARLVTHSARRPGRP
jgi:hypothetical protein